MKKIYYSLILGSFLIIGISTLKSNPQGAPVGRTGSPGDGGNTCFTAGCHSGQPVDVNNVISTNIPSEGYTPGQTYTITVTVSGSGRKGFSVSPQKADGSVVGTLTAGSGSRVDLNKYVTHTSAPNTNPATWSFSWTAPAAGTGAVDFYGAFAITRSVTQRQKLTVQEKLANGVNENQFISQLAVYPNPVVGKILNLGFELKTAGQVKVALIDMTGREINRLEEAYEAAGSKEYRFELPEMNRGIYFLQIQVNGERLSKKILINN